MTKGRGEDDRHPHRRRRLPRPERGHPRGRAPLRRGRLGLVGVLEGWRGMVEGKLEQLGREEVSGILPRGGTIIGTSRTNPYKLDGGVEKVLQNFSDATSTRSSRSAARTRSASPRGSIAEHASRRRRPEDDRQRPLRHRLHLRLRHRGHDRHRGDRPAAHDGRVAQPRHGRRGDGPPRRLDRRDERHRRRRRRDPDPRAADDGRGRVRELRRRHARGKSFSIVVVSEGYELTYESGESRLVGGEARATDQFGHVRARRRRRGARPRDRAAHRLRDARHRARPRPARRLPHRRATACSRRASGSRRPSSRRQGSSA